MTAVRQPVHVEINRRANLNPATIQPNAQLSITPCFKKNVSGKHFT